MRKTIKRKLSVKIFAGVSTQSMEDYGWYVYCNDRLVLKADRSSTTGWREEFEDPNLGTAVKIPKAHSQFSRFRGYVFFESDDLSLLPWNTKKSGINENSDIYQSVKLEMMIAMRQILDFLNELDREKDLDEKPLTELIDDAEQNHTVRLSEIANKKPSQFTAPSAKAGSVPPPKLQRISYQSR